MLLFENFRINRSIKFIGKCVSKTDTHFRFKVAMKVWNTHNHVSLLLNKNPGPASPQKQQDSVVS